MIAPENCEPPGPTCKPNCMPLIELWVTGTGVPAPVDVLEELLDDTAKLLLLDCGSIKKPDKNDIPLTPAEKPCPRTREASASLTGFKPPSPNRDRPSARAATEEAAPIVTNTTRHVRKSESERNDILDT